MFLFSFDVNDMIHIRGDNGGPNTKQKMNCNISVCLSTKTDQASTDNRRFSLREVPTNNRGSLNQNPIHHGLDHPFLHGRLVIFIEISIKMRREAANPFSMTNQ